jgi:hypothetical protein
MHIKHYILTSAIHGHHLHLFSYRHHLHLFSHRLCSQVLTNCPWVQVTKLSASPPPPTSLVNVVAEVVPDENPQAQPHVNVYTRRSRAQAISTPELALQPETKALFLNRISK